MLDDLRHFPTPVYSRARRREYLWAILAAVLWIFGPSLTEEEGARRASANGEPPTLFADDPRELHELQMIWPLGCFAPKGEWIHQWGDGRTPYEAHPITGERAWKCVNADLRGRI
jgi:hypothetical protein